MKRTEELYKHLLAAAAMMAKTIVARNTMDLTDIVMELRFDPISWAERLEMRMLRWERGTEIE